MHQRAMSFQSHKKTLTSNIFEDSVLNEASGIRTPDNLIKSQVLYQRMQQSKCCALPLGDSPIGKVDKGIRTLGLQSHNLAR